MPSLQPIHQVSYGNLQVNVAPTCLHIKEKGVLGWMETNIPLSQIADVEFDTLSGKLDIIAQVGSYSLYLGGLLTAEVLYKTIVKLIS
jgi:hypothetical protein